jgi:alkylation response protein AidB-like acyl-CoA dehydrogenase
MSADLRYENVTADQRDLAIMAEKYFAGVVADPLGGADLGWFSVGTDPELGGVGGTTVDLAILIESAGATRAVSCLGESALLALPLLAGALQSDVRQRLLDGAVSVATPAISPWQAAQSISAEGQILTGSFVVLGVEAPELLLVPVRTRDGERVVLIDAADGTVTTEALPSSDVTRHLLRIRLDGTGAGAIVGRALGADLFAEYMARRASVVALDAVGAARAALDRTLKYAAVRTQFGQPIGSFQAYKHRCANAFIELKLAQSVAFGAARVAGTVRGSLLGLAAGRCATANATFICGEAVQLHGGIGYTWEAGIHAFLKRARMDEIIGRGCARARATLMELDDLGSDIGPAS